MTRTYTESEVRAIVAERLEKAAEEIYPGDDFISRVPPLKGQGKSYWESRKEAAGIILAMAVDAIADLARRDARVRLGGKLEAAQWMLDIFNSSLTGAAIGIAYDEYVAELQATADAGEKEASDE